MAAVTYPSIPLDERKLRELVAVCRRAGIKYGLGSKAPSLTAVPGKQFTRIDCSGFVRWAIYQASGNTARMPDGSWHQGKWAERARLKKSDVAACCLKDGRVRLAYWHNKSGVSHIALVLNGKTLESCGGRGPCRRTWAPDKSEWMRESTVYVLEMDVDGAGHE